MGGGTVGAGGHSSWSSADFNSNSSPIRSYGYLGSVDPNKVNLVKSRNVNDAAIISEIDCIMRRHTDNLLHAIDGLSARLLQLESRTHQLELSVDDLKVSVGNNHGSTDGKMRQTENILLEVQSRVQDLKYKQEVVNAQMQLEKLQMSKVVEAQETQSTAHTDPSQQTTSTPLQSNRQFSIPSLQPFPSSISPCAPPPPLQTVQPSIQLPTQYPPTPTPAFLQLDTYFPLASQTQEMLSQQFRLTPPSLYPRDPSQTYPPSFQLPPSPPTGGSHMYESLVGRSSYGASSSVYSPPTAPSEPFSYSGSSSHYGNDLAWNYQPRSPGTGGNNYPQIPTARILPQAIPAASAVSGGSRNRVPIDDVVDKVANMGFPREVVKATVRKLTENGQAVDLNVVLDKLMNDGSLFGR